ncbi:MAG: hypothetical protein QXS37_03180 [Candidatus Aenigmatarchaeota archaeon]
MEDPRIEKTKLETILKEIGRDTEVLIEQMKSSYFVDKLVRTISSTIHGRARNYGLDCCRLVVSSFSPWLTVYDPETKMLRRVRGTESHVLTGMPSTGKSSWFSIIENQGLNVIKTQVSTQGGILGTPIDMGLTEYLQNSVWLLPEAEITLSNPVIVNILRSLIEEQEVGKTSAYVVSKTRLLKIHSSVCLSLVNIPSTGKEIQLLSRLHRINFDFNNIEEVLNVGQLLTNNLMEIPEISESFEPEPRHYFGLIANRILDLGLNENRFLCSLSSEHKREIYNTWYNLVHEYYENSRMPKGIALRDLVEGFRSSQNYGLLNLFQREVKQVKGFNVLYLTEEDLNHGLEFMERVMETRSEYETETMRETRFRVPVRTIVQIYELHRQGLSAREISRRVGLSHTSVSRYLREMGVEE